VLRLPGRALRSSRGGRLEGPEIAWRHHSGEQESSQKEETESLHAPNCKAVSELRALGGGRTGVCYLVAVASASTSSVTEADMDKCDNTGHGHGDADLGGGAGPDSVDGVAGTATENAVFEVRPAAPLHDNPGNLVGADVVAGLGYKDDSQLAVRMLARGVQFGKLCYNGIASASRSF